MRKGVSLRDKVDFSKEIGPSRRSRPSHKQQTGEQPEIANPHCVRAFHAVFGRADRMHNQADNPKHSQHFQTYGCKCFPCRRQRAEATADEYKQRVVNPVRLQEKETNLNHCRDLQHVAKQRHQSTVRTLAFRYARFVVYVEYAYFSAAEAADKVNCKAKPKHNVRIRRQLYRLSAKRINQQMTDQNTSKCQRISATDCIHRINIRIQTINTANLLFEQVL